MTTYDHVQELRAELAATMDASERATIAELAPERLAKEEAVFDAAFLGIEPPR